MTKLIRLETSDGEVFVNPKYVTSVRASTNGKGSIVTVAEGIAGCVYIIPNQRPGFVAAALNGE